MERAFLLVIVENKMPVKPGSRPMSRLDMPTSVKDLAITPSTPIQRSSVMRAVSEGDCKELVLKNHYSHRMPSAIKLCFADMVNSPREALACVIFSHATGRWEVDNLWELTRLVRTKNYDTSLTKLIAKAMGHIRQNKLADLVISFADAEEDHHGGIYQAGSWLYDGMRGERLDGFMIDGNFTPARTCNGTWGTSSEVELPKLLAKQGREAIPHFDQGKHCYWRALNKTGMRKAVELGLRSQAYPKPMVNSSEGVNYRVEPHLRKGIKELPTFSDLRDSVKIEAVEPTFESLDI